MKDNQPTALILRSVRKSLGLTQNDAAKVLKVSRQMVNMLEKGRIGLSQDLAERYGTLIDLVAYYGREREMLMEGRKLIEPQVRDFVERHVGEIMSFVQKKSK